MSRKVVTRSPHREVGVINAGWLLDHPVEHESQLERRFVIGALSCPVVRDIIHQPFTIPLDAIAAPNGPRYTPDFKIVFRDGSALIAEVKPEKKAAELKPRLDLIRRCLAAEGLRFLIATDELIDANKLSARALLLMRYGRLRFSDGEALACLTKIRELCNSNSTVKILVEQGLSESLIWNLVAKHLCRVPPNFSVDSDQIIITDEWEGDCHDYFLSWFGASAR